jgi:hypothetical protein
LIQVKIHSPTSAVQNSKAVGAPTPDGFAFVPLRAAFLGRQSLVVEPGSEAAASPSFGSKKGDPSPTEEE